MSAARIIKSRIKEQAVDVKHSYIVELVSARRKGQQSLG
jgi:hypothetical protein